MTLLGVRLGVWLSVFGLAAGALALSTAIRGDAAAPSHATPTSAIAGAGRPEVAAARNAGRGTRIRVGDREVAAAAPIRSSASRVFEGTIANAGARPAPAGASAAPAGRRELAGAGGERPAPALPAAPRPAEVASLERDALRSLTALEREDADALEAEIDAEVASLEAAPGESPAELAARRDDTRARLVSDEFLLRARLSDLYAQQVYPYGFPVERDVVPMERRLIQGLPPADRAALLRQALDAGAPGRPVPQFYPPESGLVYPGAPGL